MEQRPVAFGVLLRQYRLAAGLSQEALAERSGLSRRGIADLERGARNFPYGDTVRRLATALDLDALDRAALLSAGQREGASAAARSSKLPLEPSALVGRQRELSELQLLLKSVRLLTLTGAAGIGKTRLALEVARDAEPRFGHGAVFVDLAPVRDPSLVPQALAAALHLREEANKAATEIIQDRLITQQVLVVLDNCEHLLHGTTTLADSLIRSCGGLRILATSREAMRIRGETVWPVPALRDEEAQDLFVARAHAAQASLDFSNTDNAVIASICQRLDGIPLAIELAAARVPALGLSEIEARLGERLRLLSGGSRRDSPRHQTLRAAIDWSYALLSEQERLLFERASVFAGGWSLAALEPVCAWQGLQPGAVLDTFTGLVEKSLVIVDQSGGHMRYRLLETIREYASERLAASQHLNEQRRRHAAYFRSLAETGAAPGRAPPYANAGQAAWLEQFDREHDNFRTALTFLTRRGNHAEALRVATALTPFWIARGHFTEAQLWLDATLHNCAHIRTGRERADGLSAAANVALRRADFPRAKALFEESLVLFRALPDEREAARALDGLGITAVGRGDITRAIQHYEESLALAHKLGETAISAWVLNNLGSAVHREGDLARARALFEQSLRLHNDVHQQEGIVVALMNLASIARRTGDLDRAATLLDESLTLGRRLGLRPRVARGLLELGRIALDTGDHDRAAELIADSLSLSQEIGEPTRVVECMEALGRVATRAQRPRQAVRIFGAANALRESVAHPVPPVARPEHERDIAAVRSMLDVGEFEAGWQIGRELPLDQSVQFALEAAFGLYSR